MESKNCIFYQPFTALKDSFIGLIRQQRVMNSSLEVPSNLFEVYSADTGQQILQNDLLLDHQIELTKNKESNDLISLHSNFGNMSPITHLAIWSASQSTLYSLVIDLGGQKSESGDLDLIPKVEMIQKRSLPFKPSYLLSAKQKSAYKLVVMDQESKQIHVYSHDKLKEEMIVQVDVKNAHELQLMQQSVGLLYYTKQEIGFFKIIKASSSQQEGGKKKQQKEGDGESSSGSTTEESSSIKQLKSKTVCHSNFYDIDQIVFDPLSAGTFIALSKRSNAIVLFQASGSGKDIQCKIKGIIRFAQSKKAKSYQMSKIELQLETSLLFISFENSSQFAIIPYDNSNLITFLLNLHPDYIIDNYLYEANTAQHNDNPSGSSSSLDLYQIDRYLLLKEDYIKSKEESQPQMVTTQTTIMELAIDKEIQSYIVPDKSPVEQKGILSEIFTLEFLRQMFVPFAIFIVLIYQFYFKKSGKVEASYRTPRTKAEAESEITRKINNLSSQIGGRDRLNAEAQLTRLENEMSGLADSFKGTANTVNQRTAGTRSKYSNQDDDDY